MKYFVAGGAGFIGSHMVHHLLRKTDAPVVVFDNFLSGTRAHLGDALDDPRVEVVEADIKDLDAVTRAMQGAHKVYHFASNPDIAKAMTDPSVDFWEGTYLTHNVIEAMRLSGAREIVYASGSGVYGDCGDLEVTEDHSPMLPISTYGASKLACEVLIHSYVHMFGFKARVVRFANVVGDQQTHGVAYDFIRRLRTDSGALRILGDGKQSKSYIHVDDVVAALEYFAVHDTEPYSCYHIATGDYLTVKEIADLVVQEMGLTNVRYDFAGGDRGWKGDVPVVRFNLAKAHGRGWRAKRSSAEAMTLAIRAMIEETGKTA